VSAIETILFSHFRDLDSGGFDDNSCLSVDESELESYRQDIQTLGDEQYNLPMNVTIALSADNLNHALLVQFLCVQKRRRDVTKSAKRKRDKAEYEKKKHAKMNQETRIVSDRRPSDTSTSDADSDEDDDFNDFIKTVRSFCHHIKAARLQNQLTDKEMMDFILTELGLVTKVYDRRKEVNVFR
jgi:hypothetical protein